jgi:hypothetical protein
MQFIFWLDAGGEIDTFAKKKEKKKLENKKINSRHRTRFHRQR